MRSQSIRFHPAQTIMICMQAILLIIVLINFIITGVQRELVRARIDAMVSSQTEVINHTATLAEISTKIDILTNKVAEIRTQQMTNTGGIKFNRELMKIMATHWPTTQPTTQLIFPRDPLDEKIP